MIMEWLGFGSYFASNLPCIFNLIPFYTKIYAYTSLAPEDRIYDLELLYSNLDRITTNIAELKCW